MKKNTLLYLSFGSIATTFNAQASDEELQTCLMKSLKTADLTVTVGELKRACNNLLLVAKKAQHNKVESFFKQELKTKNLASAPYVMTPYVMTPHRMNYLLPVSYSDNINKEDYDIVEGWADNFEDIEIKYQLSFRVPLLTERLFTQGDGVAFAFTLQSWWQIYARSISRPFRETNYQPEIFYYTPLSWQPLEGNTAFLLGFEHQSNGNSSSFSRSWNRLYANFVFAKDNYVISFKPWWRIPEGNKVSTAMVPGDDNPDITDYMGNFELSLVYKWDDYDVFFKGRENFKAHKGYVELGVTFPIFERLKGYIQYTNGYGESLIDYNNSQQTIGIGFSLTDYFQD
ncbi:phospholipase [Colwellia sp. PAMC 20917]|uniref:phospholipase A n=1 Tax=Colwellia sp. PAMC 20917 TaxID=1816218 RepID=UPI0008787F1D|nr:phospholipase A [Colwellia sp. PAMC 20917]AOW77899.1 phospholipase [Colwellia sp. PAMC 20917]